MEMQDKKYKQDRTAVYKIRDVWKLTVQDVVK